MSDRLAVLPQYLLPKRLGRGLYQLQVRATDAAGNQSTNTSVRFRVR